MNEIASFRSFHAGTYASNPLATTACMVALDKILVKDAFKKTQALGDALAEGHNRILKKHGLPYCAVNIGCNGTVFWCKTPPTNYREWLNQDFDLFWRYWHMNLNRGVIPRPSVTTSSGRSRWSTLRRTASACSRSRRPAGDPLTPAVRAPIRRRTPGSDRSA
jgi:glutamate-1-semialdehyde aminotransferase